MTSPVNAALNDSDSGYYLSLLEEKKTAEKNYVPNVKSILVVLSTRAMAFDADALRYKIKAAYPNAKIFLKNSTGTSFKSDEAPTYVDLLVDFSGPGEKQNLFYARKLRKTAKMAVGRNAGFFRKNIYDRVVDDRSREKNLPRDFFERERIIQREVLALAGVPSVPASSATADLSNSIALELPPLLNK